MGLIIEASYLEHPRKKSKRQPHSLPERGGTHYKKESKKWRANAKTPDITHEEDLYVLNLRLNNLISCTCETIYSLYLDKCPQCEVANPNYLIP